MKNDNNLRAWILVMGTLVIFALAAVGVILAVRNSTRELLSPVNSITSNVSTQVAQVLNPTPTILPDPRTIVYQVRTLARLETIQYTLEKVVTAETNQGVLAPLFGDRLIFIAHGEVIAGIDMMKLGPADMWAEGTILYVRLPEPEIFMATLNNDESYVYDRETGILTHGSVNLETNARQVAEQEIEAAALEDGILEQARVNAETYLYRFLRNFNYSDVVFVEPEE